VNSDNRTMAAKKEKREKKSNTHEEGDFAEDIPDDDKLAEKEKKSMKETKLETMNAESILKDAEPENEADEENVPRRSKKERKAERRAREAVESNANATVPSEPSEPAHESKVDAAAATKTRSKKNNHNREKRGRPVGDQAGTGNSAKAEGKAARFIVFIGNVYTHFAFTKKLII